MACVSGMVQRSVWRALPGYSEDSVRGGLPDRGAKTEKGRKKGERCVSLASQVWSVGVVGTCRRCRSRERESVLNALGLRRPCSV